MNGIKQYVIEFSSMGVVLSTELLVAVRFHGGFDTTLRQYLLIHGPSPNTGGSLVSVFLMSVQRNILLQVRRHSSCQVKG